MLSVTSHLENFIGPAQREAIEQAAHTEEGQFFQDKMDELREVIRAMPSTYETDAQGMNAVAHLHYFIKGADWYITEKDRGDPADVHCGIQRQAYGLADLFGDGGELGYISIQEVIDNGGELDLHWIPKTLREITGEEDGIP